MQPTEHRRPRSAWANGARAAMAIRPRPRVLPLRIVRPMPAPPRLRPLRLPRAERLTGGADPRGPGQPGAATTRLAAHGRRARGNRWGPVLVSETPSKALECRRTRRSVAAADRTRSLIGGWNAGVTSGALGERMQ